MKYAFKLNALIMDGFMIQLIQQNPRWTKRRRMSASIDEILYFVAIQTYEISLIDNRKQQGKLICKWNL